jgi:hypothetical protein
MAATKYDFNIEQGTSFRLSLVYKDSSGNPIDLTNWCARLIWTTDKNITQTFISTNGDLSLYKFYIEPLLGKLTLIIPPETTNSFNFIKAKYDLELQNDEDIYVGGGKDVVRLLYGNVLLIKRYSNTSTLLDCDT